MKSVFIDPARRLDLQFRINRDGNLLFTVVNSDGEPFPLTYENFQLTIRNNPGDRISIIDLVVGSGLVIADNQLEATFTDEDTDINQGEYFWELINVDTNKTWLCGKAFFYNGESDASINSSILTINISNTISIELSASAVSISGGGAAGVQSIVAGTNISVDATDPQNPIVSASESSTPTLKEVIEAGNVIDSDESISVTGDSGFSIGAPANPLALQITGAGTVALTLGSDATGDMYRRSSTGILERRTPTQVRSDISAQPSATALSEISGLSPSNDDFLQRKAGAWTNRTVAQVKTDLGVSGTNTGDQTITLTGDVTGSGTGSFATTLATVNANVGTFGSSTAASQVTVNGKGQVTAASSITVQPAVGSITGLGTGVATALAVNVGSAGAPVILNGAGGTPSSLTGSNITGVPITAGTTGTLGIDRGGTGQATQTEAFDALAPSTTNGDIIYHNGTDNTRLPVGSTGAVLTVSGGVPAWVTPNTVTYFGDGADGDLTVTTNNATSGPITAGALTRDAYFNNLTISGSGSIRTDGFRLYVKGILDISAAGADAITANGRPATSNGLADGTAGVASSAVVSGTVGGAPVARNGGAGGTATGSTPTASVAANIANGGVGGTGQAGGSGSGGSGGAASIGGTILSASFFGRYTDHLLYGASLLLGGTAGGAGGGGGGDGTAGGGGGSGGSGGGYLGIWARTINRSSSTAAGAISSKGAAGGNGGTAAAGNRGGGAGGGGGGGGPVYLVYGSLTGTSATNCIDVSGGAGGNGGSGTGTGTGGRGGNGGSGGRIDTIDIIAQTGTNQFGTAGTASSTVSGNAGTSGGAGDTEQKTL